MFRYLLVSAACILGCHGAISPDGRFQTHMKIQPGLLKKLDDDDNNKPSFESRLGIPAALVTNLGEQPLQQPDSNPNPAVMPPTPIDDSDHPLPAELFALPPEAQRNIRAKCQGRQNPCKGQKPGNANRRAVLKEIRSKSLQKNRGRKKGKGKKEADDLVEANFQKVFRAKQQYYDLLGISDVADPADDGLFGGDMLLNDEQLDSLIQTTKVIQDSLDQAHSSRRRRSALFFEDANFEVQLWSKMPIPYFIDTSSGFTTAQRNLIKAALSELTNSTGRRVTFQEISAPIDSPYLEYTSSSSPGICGASYVGQQQFGDNPVYLNFNCKGIYGTILHETMHALGVAHHHTRLDRRFWLTVNWNNVDPSCLDSFALNDMNMFTTYGTPYSYGSVMHYNNMVCAIDPSVPTLVPTKALPVGVAMGQRTALNQGDIDLLIRIYCCGGLPPSRCPCKDISPFCGYDANVGYCTDTRYRSWMASNCSKSCNLCACPPK